MQFLPKNVHKNELFDNNYRFLTWYRNVRTYSTQIQHKYSTNTRKYIHSRETLKQVLKKSTQNATCRVTPHEIYTETRLRD